MPSNDAIEFALSNTKDPLIAQRLATQLGQAAVEVVPGVCYPPAWVLAKQKSSAKLAAYAVKYCNDPATLTSIAGTTTRVMVVAALYDNAYLSDSTRRQLLQKDGFPSSPRKRQEVPLRSAKELGDIRATALRKLETTVSRGNITYLNDYLDHANMPPALIDEMFEKLFAVSPIESALYLLSAVSGVSHIGQSATFLRKYTGTISSVLGRFSEEQKTEIIRTFVTTISNNYYDNESSYMIGKELVGYIFKYAHEVVPKPSSYRSSIKKIFAEDAIEEIFKNPLWLPLLHYQDLSVTNLKRLLASTPPEERLGLLLTFSKHPELIAAVFESLPSGVLISDFNAVNAVLSVLRGRSDALFLELVRLADGKNISNYLAGGWRIGSTIMLPTVEELPGLLLRVADVDHVERNTMNYFVSSGIQAASPEYVHILIDRFPGFMKALIDNPDFTGYIFERLTGTGVSVEVIVDQLPNAGNVSLDDFCQMLSAFSRVTTT